jgi:hypothetical protein
MDAAPFDALLDRYQSGEATADELGELDRQLRADAGKRRILVERALLEVQLRRFFAGLAPTQPRRGHGMGRSGWQWFMIAACILLPALGVWLLLTLRGAGGPGAMVEAGVLRVNNVATAVVPAGAEFEVGGKVPAVLRLPDGAHAELDPGTRAAIHGAGSRGRRIDLAQGGGEFRVAGAAAPLHVETAAGTVIAGSAQFTLRLATAADGAATCTVAVTAGTVEVQAGGRIDILMVGEQRVLTAPAN